MRSTTQSTPPNANRNYKFLSRELVSLDRGRSSMKKHSFQSLLYANTYDPLSKIIFYFIDKYTLPILSELS